MYQNLIFEDDFKLFFIIANFNQISREIKACWCREAVAKKLRMCELCDWIPDTREVIVILAVQVVWVFTYLKGPRNLAVSRI